MKNNLIFASTSLRAPVEIHDIPGGLRLDIVVQLAIQQHGVPTRFWWHGVVTIENMPVDRDRWHLVTPKPGMKLMFYLSHAGGEGGGAKNILGAVAAVFLSLATAGIATLGTVAFGLSQFAANAVALGVGLVGQLAIRALFAPPQSKNNQTETVQATRASVQGNVLRQGQIIPRVAGRLRIAPPLLGQPRSTLLGDDTYAEAVFALAGPHQITDVQINGVPASDLNDVEIWIDDGTAPARTNQLEAFAVTQQVGAELTQHATRAGESGYNDRELVNQSDPSRSLPTWTRVVTRAGCNYADLFLTIGAMFDSSAGDVDQVLWLRFRARKEGTSEWKNIGTVGYVGKGQSSYSRRVRFHFGVYPGGLAESPRSRHGFRAVATLPVVTVDHVNFKTTDVAHFPAAYTHNWIRVREGIDVWLNDAYYLDATARYEIEVMRSEMVEADQLSDIPTMRRSSDGAYVDYFDARQTSGTWRTEEDVADQADIVYVQGLSSVFERPPVKPTAPVATIQVRVKNRDIPQISALCTGLVPDLVDGQWSGWVPTRNPASHYRFALTGSLTSRPISIRYVDDEVIADWHAECAARGYTCDLLLQDSMGDALRSIASCGYAKHTIGLKYGVVYWRDTSNDVATQMFTPRNIKDLEWTVAYTERPVAFNITFANAARNYEQDSVLVYDPYAIPGATTTIEAVTYEGLTETAKVQQRGVFDFGQARNAVRWSWSVAIEHLATREGEIAILSHDALDRHVGYARIKSIPSSTTFVIDDNIKFVTEGDILASDNVLAEADVLGLGAGWGVMVRTGGGGVQVLDIVSYDAGTRTVTVSSTQGMDPRNICIFGPLVRLQRRVQVLRIEPAGLHTARITAQNEFVEA